MEEIALVYVGSGDALIGIPARDLTKEEVRKYGGETWLTQTGLYAKPEKKMDRPAHSNKMESSGSENK